MQNDPYAPPVSENIASAYPGITGVTQVAMQHLSGTKPWVRFISVLMFVGAGFMLILALVMGLVGGSVFANAGSGGRALPAGMTLGMTIVYGLLSVLYIYPALKLWKYANDIASLLASGSVADLENALGQQRSFWKFVGIVVIVMFALYMVTVAVVIMGASVAAMKGQG